MIPRGISDRHIRAAARWVEQHGIPAGRAARRYAVHVDGGIYPPKLLISLAVKLATGKEHGPNDFIATEAVSYFKARDYQVDGKRQPRPVTEAAASGYWVVKGNPRDYDWDRDLTPGHVERWRTRYPEPGMRAGDRVFLWESGGRSRIIGFAAVTEIMGTRAGAWRFRIKYLTERLDYMPGLKELRANRALRGATFLKAGVFRTIYPLDEKQAAAVYRTVISENPSEDIWREISDEAKLPDVDLSYREGRKKLVRHLRAERAPGLARDKKAQFRRTHGGKLFCECCVREYAEYGTHREDLFEVHHLRPLGKNAKPVDTKLSDLAVICSNCHRVIHRIQPMPDIASFKRRFALQRKGTPGKL